MGTGMTEAPYYMPGAVWRNLLGNSWAAEREGKFDVTLW